MLHGEIYKEVYFLSIQGTSALLQSTMYDICAHSSLPTSAIIVLGLLKRNEYGQF